MESLSRAILYRYFFEESVLIFDCLIFYSDVNDFWDLVPVESISQGHVVRSVIFCDHPFARLLKWLELVFDDPIARVTCLTPPSSEHLFPTFDFFIHRVNECLFSVWSQAVSLKDPAIKIVMAMT